MLFIGDVHGKWTRYRDLIDGQTDTVQLGDFMVGYKMSNHAAEARILERMEDGNHRFIRGNHDNPAACKATSRWIPDGTVEGAYMFMGGAYSIDRAALIEGADWWADEELSTGELGEMIDLYEETKPSIMVTHDAPEKVARQLFSLHPSGVSASRTRRALDIMLDIHRPDAWVFGHWHKSRRQIIEGTEFICLRELEIANV